MRGIWLVWALLTGFAAPLCAQAVEGDTGRVFDLSGIPEETRDLVEMVVHGLDTFQPAATLFPIAQLAAQNQPDLAYAHYLLSDVVYSQEMAREELQIAFRLAGEASSAERRFLRAAYLLRFGHHSGLKLMLRLAEEHPDDPWVRLELGRAYLERLQPDEALPHLLRGVEVDPGTARLRVLLADALLLKGDLDQALGGYREALRRLHPQAYGEQVFAGIVTAHLAKDDTQGALSAIKDLFARRIPPRPSFRWAKKPSSWLPASGEPVRSVVWLPTDEEDPSSDRQTPSILP